LLPRGIFVHDSPLVVRVDSGVRSHVRQAEHKLAEVVDGVNLSWQPEGDVFKIADDEAELSIRGGRAEPAPEAAKVRVTRPGHRRETADRRS
jgi:hypothetical protein